MGLLLSSQIYFYTPVPIVLVIEVRTKRSINFQEITAVYLRLFSTSIWVMTGISNTCYDCVTSSLAWPGKQHETKRELSFPNNHNKSHCVLCRSLCISGPGDTEVTATGQVSLRVARPDSPAQSFISRVPSRGDGTRVGWENGRLVKWGMPGSGWSGDTRKGEEPGAFYHPGADSSPPGWCFITTKMLFEKD